MNFGYSAPGYFFWLLPLLMLGIPLLLWIGFASTLARSNVVDRPNRIAQWYGYSVCLVCVVVLLITSTALVNNLFTLSNPLHGEQDYGPALTSFEAYRATYQTFIAMDPAERQAQRAAPPSEAELRTRYQALRADRIDRNRYNARRTLVSSGLLTLFAVALFGFHWRWLQRLGRGEAVPAAAS
jgi:hypothetical protein